MRLQRLGDELVACAASPGQEFRELGRASFGDGRIDTLLFRGVVPAADAELELTFANVQIQADRIVSPASRVRGWYWLMGLAVPAAALSVVLYRRFARAEAA